MNRQSLSRRIAVVAIVAGAHSACAAHRTTSGGPPIVAAGRLMAYASSDDSTQASALSYGRFGISVTLNGRALLMMADHGSNYSTLTDGTIDRLGIPHWYTGAERADTLIAGRPSTKQVDETPEATVVHGDTTFRYWGLRDPFPVDSLRIGTSRQDSVVLPMELASSALTPFDGLLGRDMLSQFDQLYDMRSNVLTLFQRTRSSSKTPQWLPPGFDIRNCAPGAIEGSAIDTAGIGDEAKSTPMRRMLEQRNLQVPVDIEGRRIDALFDSGAGSTGMNWALARALGISPSDKRIQPYMAGGSRIFMMNAKPPGDSAPPAMADSTYAITGLSMQIGGVHLAVDTILISDGDFADHENYTSKPMLNVGLRALHDRQLFLSYSTGFVCVAPPSGAARFSRVDR